MQQKREGMSKPENCSCVPGLGHFTIFALRRNSGLSIVSSDAGPESESGQCDGSLQEFFFRFNPAMFVIIDKVLEP